MKKELGIKDPLFRKPYGGGNCAIFRRIACVGDSLASGEIEIVRNGEGHYLDLYEYSWGQFLARITGAKVYNFSRGGMSAKQFIEGWGEQNGCFDEEKKCQAYIVALGINDLMNMGQEVGDAGDIGSDADTFARYFSDVVTRYKKIEPHAKFFFVTMPKEESDDEKRAGLKRRHAQLMYAFSEAIDNCYVIDLNEYAPVYDSGFKTKNYFNGHMNPSGYMLTAEYLISGIHSIVSAYPREFNDVALIGTAYHYLVENTGENENEKV